jgi:hypothetical protein
MQDRKVEFWSLFKNFWITFTVLSTWYLAVSFLVTIMHAICVWAMVIEEVIYVTVALYKCNTSCYGVREIIIDQCSA